MYIYGDLGTHSNLKCGLHVPGGAKYTSTYFHLDTFVTVTDIIMHYVYVIIVHMRMYVCMSE